MWGELPQADGRHPEEQRVQEWSFKKLAEEDGPGSYWKRHGQEGLSLDPEKENPECLRGREKSRGCLS